MLKKPFKTNIVSGTIEKFTSMPVAHLDPCDPCDTVRCLLLTRMAYGQAEGFARRNNEKLMKKHIDDVPDFWFPPTVPYDDPRVTVRFYDTGIAPKYTKGQTRTRELNARNCPALRQEKMDDRGLTTSELRNGGVDDFKPSSGNVEAEGSGMYTVSPFLQSIQYPRQVPHTKRKKTVKSNLTSDCDAGSPGKKVGFSKKRVLDVMSCVEIDPAQYVRPQTRHLHDEATNLYFRNCEQIARWAP
eukprot:6910871-Prymnesium_polylepis.1